jgi:hypothetical protein
LTAWPFPLARVSFHSTGRGIFDACIDGSNHFQSDGRERKGLQMTNRTFWFCYPQQCPQPLWLHCLKRSEPPAAASNPIFWDAIWNPSFFCLWSVQFIAASWWPLWPSDGWAILLEKGWGTSWQEGVWAVFQSLDWATFSHIFGLHIVVKLDFK